MKTTTTTALMLTENDIEMDMSLTTVGQGRKTE